MRIETKESASSLNIKGDFKMNVEKEEVKKEEEKIDKNSSLFKDSSNGAEYIFRVNYRKFIHDFRTNVLSFYFLILSTFAKSSMTN